MLFDVCGILLLPWRCRWRLFFRVVDEEGQPLNELFRDSKTFNPQSLKINLSASNTPF
jgi:hypothetical protein